MKLYQCKVNGEFLKEVKARPNPLEKGKYLIPAGCTTIKPPTISEKEVAIFDKTKNQWMIKEDHRGETYYNKETKEEAVINFIGEIPSDFYISFTSIKPPDEQFIKWDKNNWVIDQVLKEEYEVEIKISNLREIKTYEAVLADNELTEKERVAIQKRIDELKGVTSEDNTQRK